MIWEASTDVTNFFLTPVPFFLPYFTFQTILVIYTKHNVRNCISHVAEAGFYEKDRMW